MRRPSTRPNQGADASRRFLLSAPVGVIAAGLLLLATGSDSLTSSWSPRTLVLVHLGTLGFLTAGMMGALYRWIPALTGSGAPHLRTVHAVHALLWIGLALLVGGLLTGEGRAAFFALTVLAASLALFLVQIGRMLRRTRSRDEVVAGLKLAVASLFLVAFLGLWMAHGHAGMRFPGPRGLWIQVHLGVGFLGWVGCTLAVAAWEFLPRHYGASPLGQRSRRATLALVAVGLLLPVLVLFVDLAGWTPAGPAPSLLALLGAVPAAGAIWLLQPILQLRSLVERRADDSIAGLRLWQAGLCAGPLVAAAALAAYFLPPPRWGLLLGWLAIWAWAGAMLHAWLQRVAQRPDASPTGEPVRVDSRTGAVLHVTSVLTGIAAIATGEPWLARATGLLLVAVGLLLGRALIHAPPAPEPGVIAAQ
jgi:hypothetical protein